MIDVTTPEGRKRLRELADKATPGPWYPCGCRFSIVSTDLNPQEVLDVCDASINDYLSQDQVERNVGFIAASREAVPLLLDALEASEAHNIRGAELYGLAARENARLRERLEKVEMAAEPFLTCPTNGPYQEQPKWAERKAALLSTVRAEATGAERERCAKVCDVKAAFNRETAEEYASEGEDMDYRRHTSRAAAFGDAAAAIRGSK